MHPGDVTGGGGLGQRSRARPCHCTSLVGVIARCRDLADATQRRDREVALLGSDKREDLHARDFFTQKAVARFRISRSTSNSATRRRSARFSADSADSVAKRSGSADLRPASSFFTQVAEVRLSDTDRVRLRLLNGQTITQARQHQP